jgi:hypothetical protein
VQNKTLQDVLNPIPHAQAPECLVFSEKRHPRLDYTCQFIFGTVLFSHYRFTESEEEFNAFPGIKINYSRHSFNGGLQITPHGLVFEKGISEKKPELLLRNGLNKAYVVDKPILPNALEYDVFAMVFYFISRYEEWQKFEQDEHGRFGVKQSILYKYNTLHRPLVDLCVQELKEKLTSLFPETNWPSAKAKILSTVDVDNLYAFKGRPLWKTLAAGVRDVLKADVKNLNKRIQVLLGKQKDPFDIYDEVPEFCEKASIPLIFFFLYRNGTKYDRGLNPGCIGFIDVFQRLKKHQVALGLHPSYYSSTEELRLAQERASLEKDLGQKVEYARQHFLRFNIRSTPQQLMQVGINADFSMGFSDAPGFRAGTSFPFYYYDFENERQSHFRFVPFCLMDGAYSIHNKKGHETVIKEMASIAQDIKRCGGYFITVFHERSFYDHLYPGFGTLYRELHLQIKALLNT